THSSPPRHCPALHSHPSSPGMHALSHIPATHCRLPRHCPALHSQLSSPGVQPEPVSLALVSASPLLSSLHAASGRSRAAESSRGRTSLMDMAGSTEARMSSRARASRSVARRWGEVIWLAWQTRSRWQSASCIRPYLDRAHADYL